MQEAKKQKYKTGENFSGKRRPSAARPERHNASPAKRDEQEAEAAAIHFPLLTLFLAAAGAFNRQ